MNQQFRIYKVFNNPEGSAEIVTATRSSETAEEICIRMNRLEPKKNICHYEVNPVLCPECLASGKNRVAIEGGLSCKEHHLSVVT